MKNLITILIWGVIAGALALSLPLGEGRAQSREEAGDTVIMVILKESQPDLLLLAQADAVYSRVELNQVPQVVKSAVVVRFAAYAIDEAYAGNDGSYKLVLKKGDIRLIVFYNGEGGFLREERGNVHNV